MKKATHLFATVLLLLPHRWLRTRRSTRRVVAVLIPCFAIGLALTHVWADNCCQTIPNATQVEVGDTLGVEIRWSGDPRDYPRQKSVFAAIRRLDGSLGFLGYNYFLYDSNCTSGRLISRVLSDMLPEVPWRTEIVGGIAYENPFEIYCSLSGGFVDLICSPNSFAPPTGNDRTFVTALSSTEVLASTSTFVDVTRYSGPVDPTTGTLLNTVARVNNGTLGPYARLRIAACGVDCQSPTSCAEPFAVFFNGVGVKQLWSPNSAHLQGHPNNPWYVSDFNIPIGKVKFPASRGVDGNPPDPARNVVDIHSAGAGEFLSIAWIILEIETMSPIILIHGNNSNGEFFVRQGLTGGLNNEFLLVDNSINLPTDSIRNNAAKLNSFLASPDIPEIIRSFGVDSVHLVAHSKGGLDAREYLARYQPDHEDEFKVLSLTTLSTPHNGSVLADISVITDNVVTRCAKVDFANQPGLLEELADIIGVDEGTAELQVSRSRTFNEVNLPLLPDSPVYNVVVGEADTNNNFMIDNTPDEYAALRTENTSLNSVYNWTLIGPSSARKIVDKYMYQVLRKTRAVQFKSELIAMGFPRSTVIIQYESLPTPAPALNDTLVTYESGEGIGTFWKKVEGIGFVDEQYGRNHANIAHAGTASTLKTWLKSIETQRGDLAP